MTDAEVGWYFFVAAIVVLAEIVVKTLSLKMSLRASAANEATPSQQGDIVKKIILLVMLLTTTLSACGAPSEQIIQTAIAKTQAAKPTATFTPSITAIPTHTIVPTRKATATRVPTKTSTPAPIILTGSGDSVVDIAKSDRSAILHAKYSGGGNFIVTNYDASNTMIDVLINTIGSYEGNLPLDFLESEHTTRFEIKASGPWELQVLPLDRIRQENVPGIIQGVGDDVIYVRGSNLDKIKASATTKGNFIVFSYSDNGIDLIFNEIAPYTGTALISPSTFTIIVKATGAWTIEITTH